ncbi:MAG: SDR family oxidoreductase [Myxococcota bacterium]
MTQEPSFDGKTALITGGADGIGAALAEVLSSQGVRVFIADIDPDRLKATAERLGCESAVCDVTDEAAVEELVESAWAALGSVDLLCANAGVLIPGSLLEVDRRDFDFGFGVNVWGIIHAVRPQVRKLREKGRTGHFLLTGSEHSLANPSYLRPLPLHLYNMTKHSVLSIGESLRAELGPEGHGVSVLCPGPVESGLSENSTAVRPDAFGDPKTVDFGKLDPEVLANLGDGYIKAVEAARIALRGVSVNAFVIPTHAFQREDVDARYKETIAGFDLLD